MKYLLLLSLFFGEPYHGSSQQLTLEECHQLARANYPSVKKLELISKSVEYDIQNAGKRFLPQVSFSGQATYQSQTINFSEVMGSLPGIALPSVSKDQYRVQGEISQLVYDGGNTGYQKELIRSNGALQEQGLEAGLYTLNSRVNTLFFSILLIDAQLKQNEISRKNLSEQIQKTEASLANGNAFRSSLNELKAEILNMEMAATDYRFNRSAYLKMLSLMIGKELGETHQLMIPVTGQGVSGLSGADINRPELRTFDLQRKVYDVQIRQLRADYIPQVSAFFQGAYGRPTINIIENRFGPWYVAGMRFNWTLGNLYTRSNRKSLLLTGQNSVEADRETFLFNVRLDLSREDEQVKKYKELIDQDKQAIGLRDSVTRSAEAQLANGVITTHEYLQKVNALNLALQNKILHEVLLLQAMYNQKFISGNP